MGLTDGASKGETADALKAAVEKRARGRGVSSSEKEKDGGVKRKRQYAAAVNEAEIEDQALINIIKYKGKLVQQAAAKWVERYETDADVAMLELLKMFFQASGVQPSLLDDTLNESDVDDVVQALVTQAKDGSLEDYLGTKQRDVRNFKDNLLTFWDTLVRECQENSLFDQKLMDKCMDYVIALSCTPPRVFRHVATLVGLQLVTSFVSVAKNLSETRETAQRQLNAEKKKRKEGPRVDSLNRTLSQTHNKITMVEEMMRKIFTGLFMHRYRDVDPDIRMSCITAIGSWIVSYPSLFLQDLYLKYIGWTLNDKNSAVRKSSVLALQALYAGDDNIPSLSLFTERFSNRMIELADDIDVNVAVSAIGLLKQLLRHQLLEDDDLGPLYEILIDEAPQIRHAVGDLVYDHLIAPVSGGNASENLEGQLERLLQILGEFSGDPILCDYVIDALWDKCKAMKDWKCITAMLLDDQPRHELTDRDATHLVRVLSASIKKAVGEKILPSMDHRKASLNKAQKELVESTRKEITTAMIKNIAKLLRKYMSDKAKVAAIVEIILYMKLELYSLQRKETNFVMLLQLVKDAFFKHGDDTTLKACVKALSFAAIESHADLQDSAQHILKDTVDDLVVKLRSTIEKAGEAEDDYSLTVNFRRLYHLQVAVNVSVEGLFSDMLGVLDDFNNLDDEVTRLILLNMFLHITWSLSSIDPENPDGGAMVLLLTKRSKLMDHLLELMDSLLDDKCEERQSQSLLSCTICLILADIWSLFSEAKLASTRLQSLGFCPPGTVLQKFWKLCVCRLVIADSDEEPTEGQSSDYMNEKDIVMTAAAKLIAHDMVPKDFLGPEIVSRYALHGKIVAETVKQLLTKVKQQMSSKDLSNLYLNAMIKAYGRHMEEVAGSDDDVSRSSTYTACKELASRLSSTFLGMARAKYRPSILNIVQGGIDYAFIDAPKQLSFLETGVIQFALKLPGADIHEILADIETRIAGIDTDQDPNGWRPYFTFVDILHEKSSKYEGPAGDKDTVQLTRQTHQRLKGRGIKGKKLFEGHAPASEDEDEGDMGSESEEHEEEDEEDDDTPLFHFRQSMKLSRESTRAPIRQPRVVETPREISSPSGDHVEYEELEAEAMATPSGCPIETMTATEEQMPARNFGWKPLGSELGEDDEEDISRDSSKGDSPNSSYLHRIRSKSHPQPISSEETGDE